MARTKKKAPAAAKSVMSRLAPLSSGQRLDYTELVAQGIPEAEARAIAQGYQGLQRSAAQKGGLLSDDYLKAYHEAAQAILPSWQHALILSSARAAAQKSGVLSSDVHVDVPLGSDSGGRKRPAKSMPDMVLKRADPLNQLTPSDLAYIKAAFGLQTPTESPVPDDVDPVPEEAVPAMEANRLVAGMDAELAAGAPTAEAARVRASRNLMERPGLYDGVGQDRALPLRRGLLLDVGSGVHRAPGYLGLDTFAFDHGTVLHDVRLGIPFPDGSVRAIRLCNSLHQILDGDGPEGDPLPLLLECQRVLMVGGRLFYEGPEPLVEPDQAWPLPGLVLASATDTAQNRPPKPGEPFKQTLERVPLRVPAYHGADPVFAPAGPLPLDVQMALAAYNTSPAQTAMAGMVAKKTAEVLNDHRVVPIVKADAMKQIVYGAVLVPNEEDTQGEFVTTQDVETAAHGWMASSRVIGAEHGAPIDAVPVESYIAPSDLEFDGPFGHTVERKGTWMLGVKINDPEQWQKVMSGEYTGFSVGGFGLRE